MRVITKPRYAVLFVLLSLVIAYALYQARFIIIGPVVKVTSHTNGERVSEPLVILEGTARNISRISLNDRQIFTDENGVWSEKLIVSSGTSIMTIKAKDRFGREITKRIQLILN
jgi:hypothetical protein